MRSMLTNPRFRYCIPASYAMCGKQWKEERHKLTDCGELFLVPLIVINTIIIVYELILG